MLEKEKQVFIKFNNKTCIILADTNKNNTFDKCRLWWIWCPENCPEENCPQSGPGLV